MLICGKGEKGVTGAESTPAGEGGTQFSRIGLGYETPSDAPDGQPPPVLGHVRLEIEDLV